MPDFFFLSPAITSIKSYIFSHYNSHVKDFSHFRSSFIWIFTQKFHISYVERLYNHYSFLDGQTIPLVVINCRPLHQLCMTYWLFLIPWFLGTFAAFQKATMSFIMPTCPNGTIQLKGFSWNFIFEDYLKICQEN